MHNRPLKETEAKDEARDLELGLTLSNIACIIIPTVVIQQIVGISPDIPGNRVLKTIEEICNKQVGPHLGKTSSLGLRRSLSTIEKFLSVDRGKTRLRGQWKNRDNVETTKLEQKTLLSMR